MDDEKLLLTEYKHFSESLLRNEEIGEKRVSFFISLVTAVIASLTALTKLMSLDSLQIRNIAICALVGLFVLGVMTFLRIINRNKVTDEYKNILTYIRENLRKRANTLQEYQLPFRQLKHNMLRGGLAETVGSINSLLLTSIIYFLFKQKVVTILPYVLITFIVSYIVHGTIIIQRKSKSKKQTQIFRAGTGSIIINSKGQVLAFERSDFLQSWQLPQGGLEIGEDPLTGAKREICEETGIKDDELILQVDEPCLTVYELPPDYRGKKTGRGQVHYWFLFKFLGKEQSITLGDKKEFRAWKWISFDKLISQTIDFRKPVYRKLFKISVAFIC